jgi:hypothetical protein
LNANKEETIKVGEAIIYSDKLINGLESNEDAALK